MKKGKDLKTESFCPSHRHKGMIFGQLERPAQPVPGEEVCGVDGGSVER